MKKAFLILIIFTAVLASCDHKADKAFVSKAYNFSAFFPEYPKQSTEAAKTEAGKLNVTMFIYDGLFQLYFVGITDLPPDLVAKSNKVDLLKSAEKTVGAHLQNSKILTEKDIAIGTHPGLQFETEGTSNGQKIYMKVRIYIVDNRQYQVYGMAQKATAVDKDKITKFINSFKLLKN
jgi:hypothetical protein